MSDDNTEYDVVEVDVDMTDLIREFTEELETVILSTANLCVDKATGKYIITEQQALQLLVDRVGALVASYMRESNSMVMQRTAEALGAAYGSAEETVEDVLAAAEEDDE